MKKRILMMGASGAVLAALCAAPAGAKVIFTGYGDFRVTPQSVYQVDGPPSVLNDFGIGAGKVESRGASVNALGLFATTDINDQTRLMMDVTYEGIGADVKTLTIQYGFVEYSDYGFTARLGKITLPFGYYNQNRFYPFQHASITAPTFQSDILGLPIADIGATVGRPFELGGGVTLTADVYGVNGFGPQSGSSTTFRTAGVLFGALSPNNAGSVVANNVSGMDVNHRIAFGGRLQLSHASLPDSSVGVSYYHDDWDPTGLKPFQMGNAHVHVVLAGFDFLTEYLMLNVKGDAGMEPNFGSPDWRTDGFFSELDYGKIFLWKKQVTPWVRYEDYMSRSIEGGGGRERLTDASCGASIQLTNGLIAKVQATDLYYRLPYQGLGDLKITNYSFTTGLTVTF
jgi:hypothetical protein